MLNNNVRMNEREREWIIITPIRRESEMEREIIYYDEYRKYMSV